MFNNIALVYSILFYSNVDNNVPTPLVASRGTITKSRIKANFKYELNSNKQQIH